MVTEEVLQKRATSMTREANKVPPVEISANGKIQQSFTGMSVSDLLFVEIFAGTARLSKHAREAGMRVLPVDKTNARSSQIYIAQYDITDQHQFESLMQVLASEMDHIAAVHLAPACGTASKAREKKLLKWVRKGFKVPVPLRSAKKPMGVDNLSGLDKIRTELANQVYEKTAAIMKFCIEADVLCSLENPENSLFWIYPDILEIMEASVGTSITFSNCMHGGKRNKLTKWWSSKDVFSDLAVVCDQTHSHAQWNPIQQGQQLIFPTAEEAAYPHLLCKRVIALVLEYVKVRGAVQPETLTEQLPNSEISSHRWVLDMLPKGKKQRPLVSEFQAYRNFLVSPSKEPEESQFFKLQLKGARVVQRQLQWGKMRVDEQSGSQIFWWCEESTGKEYQLDGIDAVLEDACKFWRKVACRTLYGWCSQRSLGLCVKGS